MRVVSRTLEFRVLGPVEVVRDGVATRIGSATQRTLLALLLMHPNEVVSTDRIIDVLWADNPPEARRKLWFHVSKLRGMLQPRGAQDDASRVLVTRPTGYALRIDLDQLDAARFERLARSARAVLEDEPARAGETLRRALALWRGRAVRGRRARGRRFVGGRAAGRAAAHRRSRTASTRTLPSAAPAS